jgi:archaellum component FlaC
MITPKIAANQSFSQLNRAHKHDEQQRQQVTGQGRTETQDIDAVKTEISAFSANPIQQFNAQFNAVVKSIRIADQAMAEISANIEQMESEVEMFVKHYPPFPPGSEERIELLSRFSALRKQIDRLTFPPDPLAQKIIGDSANDGGANSWDLEIGNKTLSSAIRRQPMHTGSEGLNLPAMPPDASDKDIADALAVLRKAWETVTERRGLLADDVKTIIGQVEKIV